jgi:AraC-like DNA-binding protein
MLGTILNLEKRVYLPFKIAALVSAMSDEGVDPVDALAGTGITPIQLQSPDTRISYQQMRQVFLNVLRMTSGDSCALRAGERMHVTAYGMYGYALMSSQYPDDVLRFALKYHHVMGPVTDMAYARDGDESALVYTPLLASSVSEDLYRLVAAFQLASHHTLIHDLFGPSFKLSGIRLMYQAPKHAAHYECVFDCPILFDQQRNELRFETRWMADTMPHANSITNAMALEICERNLLEVQRSSGVATEVSRLLYEQSGRFPSIEAMAAELKTTARSLRRRLSDEQTSYRNILAEVRMRLAIGYLQKTEMTTAEIARRLGFSDASNFRQAFVRWTRHNPSFYRNR